MIGNYEIGKFYMVPCVLTTKLSVVGNGEWVPVIGPKHADAEFINFPYQHWHIDWRFVSRRQLKRNLSERYIGHVFGIVVWERNHRTGEALILKLRQKRMMCKRLMPPYPTSVKWIPKMESAYAGHTMKNMVCPHRGLPLDGCEQDGDVVTCPGHGLKFNVITGKLVRTCPEKT